MPDKRDQQKSKKHRTERPQRSTAHAAAHTRAEHESRPFAEAGRRPQSQERA